jgi:hypothetical protein
MKKIVVRAALLSVFIFCAFMNISAQVEKKISEQAIRTLLENAAEKLQNKSYRIKSESESYRTVYDSAPSYFTSETIEYAPNGYYRISERKTPAGTTASEVIVLGKKRYERVKNGKWKIASAGNPTGEVLRASRVEPVEETIEYFYKGREVVNNQNADLYEIKTLTKFKSSDRLTMTVYIQRYWFDQNGLFLKTETVSGVDDKIISRTVERYEYDPNIKIEAPVE